MKAELRDAIQQMLDCVSKSTEEIDDGLTRQLSLEELGEFLQDLREIAERLDRSAANLQRATDVDDWESYSASRAKAGAA